MRDQLSQAAAFLDRGDLDDAAAVLDRVIAAHPRQPDALLMRALVLARSEKGPAAGAEALQQLSDSQPTFAPAAYNLGVVLRQLERHEQSLTAFERTLALEPDHHAALLNAGAAASSVNRWEDAVGYWQRATQLRPDDLNVLINLGNGLTKLGRFDESRAQFKRVLSANPRSVAALNGMGMTWRAAGRLDRAIEAYEKALQLQPDSVGVLLNHAKALAHAKRLEEAKAGFQAVAQREPTSVESAIGLSVVESQMGNRPAAIHHGRSAVQLAARSPAALFNLAALLSKETDRGALEEADELLRRALRLNPGMAEAWHCEGQVLGKLGSLDEATEAAARATVLDATQPKYGLTHADLLSSMGRRSAALTLLEKLAKDHPRVAEVHRQFGIAVLRDGNADAAVSVLTRAYKLGEDDQRTIAYLSLARTEAGDGEGASNWLGLSEAIHTTALPTPPAFNTLADFNVALAAAIRGHSRLRWEPIGLAAVNGGLTDELLADRNPATLGFARSLRAAIERFKQELQEQKDNPFLRAIPSSFRLNIWATLVEAPGQIDTHIHEASWLSGAYYVELPQGIGENDPSHAGWIEFGRPHANDPFTNATLVDLRCPHEGELLLFPSYLFHRTIPHRSGQRISVSFDLVPDSA